MRHRPGDGRPTWPRISGSPSSPAGIGGIPGRWPNTAARPRRRRAWLSGATAAGGSTCAGTTRPNTATVSGRDRPWCWTSGSGPTAACRWTRGSRGPAAGGAVAPFPDGPKEEAPHPSWDVGLRVWARQELNLGPPACKAGALELLSYAPEPARERKSPELEATPGFEPGNKGFAVPCLTTWLRRRLERETGIEPAAFSLARRRSTTELLPQGAQQHALI